MTQITLLPDRCVVEIAGADRVSFLQGLVSNDVRDAAAGRAVWAALLTPQGKYLADFFIFSDAERLLLDCAASQAALVIQKLSRLRLRAQVTLREEPGLHVHAIWDGAPPAAELTAPDPRLPEAGWRALATAPLPATATPSDWNAHRLELGLPDGPLDLEADKTVLLEANFDALNGISWTKGCYMGQELTARTKYRGLLKRRLFPVELVDPLPPPGTPVTDGGREVGTLHAGQGNLAMATLRLDAIDRPLHCAGAPVIVRRPRWMSAGED